MIPAEVECHTVQRTHADVNSTDPSEKNSPRVQTPPSATQISGNVDLGFNLTAPQLLAERSQKKGQITAMKNIQSSTWLSDIW